MDSLRRIPYVFFLIIFLLYSCDTFSHIGHFLGGVKKIPKEEVKALLGNPEFTILDVRPPKDWEASDKKVIGAIRENPKEVTEWARKYPKNQKLILYCA